eukprot:m.95486 g.95486  ORF g.95486 m.95486 type:complete len:75 (+) comp16598_c0_seq1:744-968(+)
MPESASRDASVEKLNSLKDNLRRLFLVEKGRFQIGVFESGAGALDDVLEEYRQRVTDQRENTAGDTADAKNKTQ